jgi:hypothetical protein
MMPRCVWLLADGHAAQQMFSLGNGIANHACHPTDSHVGKLGFIPKVVACAPGWH